MVYGQRGVGKTALLTAFAEKNRPYDIPLPTALPGKCAISGDRSLENRGKRFHGTLPGKKYYSVYPEKKVIAKSSDHRKFSLSAKGGYLFLQELIRYLKEHREVSLLVILTTYASGWVENSMISKIGNLAFSVSGFLKVKELPFSVMRRIFPGGTLQKSIELYAVLGGMPGLWKLLELSASVEENLTTLFLEKTVFFRN